MRALLSIGIFLALAASAAAQTADRLYVMDCGHNSAKVPTSQCGGRAGVYVS